jgi:hypothetical protein
MGKLAAEEDATRRAERRARTERRKTGAEGAQVIDLCEAVEILTRGGKIIPGTDDLKMLVRRAEKGDANSHNNSTLALKA